MRTALQIVFILNLHFVYCQAGVYKEALDFSEGHLMHMGSDTRIRTYEISGRNAITVKHNDSVFRYLKSELYGYRDKEGNEYRFFNSEIYSIINSREQILIYRKTMGTGLKNSPIIDTYFFSRNAAAEILPLSLRALETEFTDHKKFTALIELFFRNDAELTLYDPVHKMYKLNRLFELSTNF
jgi:hypothetical protein